MNCNIHDVLGIDITRNKLKDGYTLRIDVITDTQVESFMLFSDEVIDI